MSPDCVLTSRMSPDGPLDEAHAAERSSPPARPPCWQARIDLVTQLEPQFGEDECLFLAAACAKEKRVTNVAIQTQPLGVGGGWSAVLDDFLSLEPGARLKLLHSIPTRGGNPAPREVAAYAKLAGLSGASAGEDRGERGGGGGGGGGGEAPEEKLRPSSSDGEHRPRTSMAKALKKASGKDKESKASKSSRRLMGKQFTALLAEAKGGELRTEEMVLRVVGELWAKKIIDDIQADTRTKPRMTILQFLQDYFLRQYGVRALAAKNVADVMFTVRQLLSGEDDTGEPVRIENRARMELFNQMCGFGEGASAWRAKKLNFFMWFVQRVVAREVQVNSLSALGESFRERLTKRHLLVRLASIGLELHKCVADTSVRQAMVEMAQQMTFEDLERKGTAADRLVVDLEAYMLKLMDAWDASEAEVQARRSTKLDALLREAVTEEANGEMSISFDEFEQLVADIRQRGGVSDSEGQADALMDLFDEGLVESEQQLGEATDVITREAFVSLAQRTGLELYLAPSSFVDPLKLSLEERAGGLHDGKSAPEVAAAAAEGEPGSLPSSVSSSLTPTPELSSRTFKNRVAKVAGGTRAFAAFAGLAQNNLVGSKPQYVLDMVRAAVANCFLFRHLDDDAMLKVRAERACPQTTLLRGRPLPQISRSPDPAQGRPVPSPRREQAPRVALPPHAGGGACECARLPSRLVRSSRGCGRSTARWGECSAGRATRATTSS